MSAVETPPTGGRRRHALPLWLETVLLLVGALVLAIVIKSFFAQAFYVPSRSMEPGLVKNDRILVEKPSYWFGGSPQRGDVVVFADPGRLARPRRTTPARPTRSARRWSRSGSTRPAVTW